MTVWGRAGVRLSEAEIRGRRLARAHRREAAAESQRRAHAAWRRGLVAPWRITLALDQGNHGGPEVDIACGTAEPAVDQWEAGIRYPTFEQLLLLADLTGFTAEWFTLTDEPLDIQQTSMWGHLTKRQRERWRPPILLCVDVAIENCPGTVLYDELHLFCPRMVVAMSFSVWVVRYVDGGEVPIDRTAFEEVLTEHGCVIPWKRADGQPDDAADGGPDRGDLDDRRVSVLVDDGNPAALCEIWVYMSEDGEVESLTIDRPSGDAIWPLLYGIIRATDSFLIAPPADIAAAREELLAHIPEDIFSTYVVAQGPSDLPQG